MNHDGECVICGNDLDGDSQEHCFDCDAQVAYEAAEELRWEMTHDDF